jgi:arylsulfatase A-like enzyme
MPRLHALGQRGVTFQAHHSVFPTVTRVNASSLATGTYPESHGLLGNTVYSEKTFPTRGIDTSNHRELEALEKAEGVLLTAPTIGTTLRRAGKRLAVFSAGSSGAAKLLGSPAGVARVVNPNLVDPADLRQQLVALLGEPPEEAVPNHRRNRWVVDAYLRSGLADQRADVTAIWFGDPDATAHATGIGSDETRQALRYVDDEIGRIEDTLRERRLLPETNIIVTSDHGFSTHTGELKLAALLAPLAYTLSDGTPDIVVTEGAINFRGPKDSARLAAFVAMLQKRPEVGAIFTRASAPGAMNGRVSGTLSFDVARWEHQRSADILVSGNWSAAKNEAGWPGHTTQGGLAGHGTSSPFDIHNTLMAAGPDFREHTTSLVPTSNADIAPTLLRLAGVAIPRTMTGRSIEEALTRGPEPSAVAVGQHVETARAPDGRYEVSAHISSVGKSRYLDYTEVRR